MEQEVSVNIDEEIFVFYINSKSSLGDLELQILIGRIDKTSNNYGPFFSFEEVLNRERKIGILQYKLPFQEMKKYGKSYEKAILKFNKLKSFI